MTETPTHRTAVLLSEHADLLQKGMPEEPTRAFWAKVATLPEAQQEDIKRLAATATALQSAFHPGRQSG